MLRFRVIITVILVSVLMAALIPAQAQQPAAETARLRIGYFAFDASKYDTFIDGELVYLWNEGGTGLYQFNCNPESLWLRCLTATPFFNFPLGKRTFAFVPKGKGLSDAIFGPKEVTIEATHAYSLVVTGSIDDKSLNLLLIDETDAFKGVDTSTNFTQILVNNLKGPAFEGTWAGNKSGPLERGQYAAWFTKANAGFYLYEAHTVGDKKELFHLTAGNLSANVSDLVGVVGIYPGKLGQDYLVFYNWGVPGQITLEDGGTIKLGESASGQLLKTWTQVRYFMTLDQDTTVSIVARSAGKRTSDPKNQIFDPALFVYNAKGVPIAWNDDSGIGGDPAVAVSSALKEIRLKAGTYAIQVGGSGESITGPYTLTVETAKK